MGRWGPLLPGTAVGVPFPTQGQSEGTCADLVGSCPSCPSCSAAGLARLGQAQEGPVSMATPGWLTAGQPRALRGP